VKETRLKDTAIAETYMTDYYEASSRPI
jgi:hypothetical protein